LKVQVTYGTKKGGLSRVGG